MAMGKSMFKGVRMGTSVLLATSLCAAFSPLPDLASQLAWAETISAQTVASAQQDLKKAQAELDAAKKKQKAAQAAYDKVSQALYGSDDAAQDTSQAASEAGSGSGALQAFHDADAAATQLDFAKIQLSSAQSSAGVSSASNTFGQAAIGSAQRSYDNALAAYNVAKQACDAAEKQFQAAERKLTDLQHAEARYRWEAEIAESDIKNIQDSLTSLEKDDAAAKQRKLKTAQEDLADEQERLDRVPSSIQSTKDKIETYKNTLSEKYALNSYVDYLEAQEAADKVQSELAAAKKGEAKAKQGSLAFFKEVAAGKGTGSSTASDAVRYLENATYKDKTIYGDPDDATSLDNIQRAIDFIKEGNKLRSDLDIPELKVKYDLMAKAQSNANFSDTWHDHSSQFGETEILCWSNTPYASWVNTEKAVVERMSNKDTAFYYGPNDKGVGDYIPVNEEAVKLFKTVLQRGYTSSSEISKIKKADKKFWSICKDSVGHYLAFVNKDYKSTGFGACTRKAQEHLKEYGFFDPTCSQVLLPSDNQALTVDEFEKRFKEYRKSLASLTEIKELESKLTQANKKVSEARQTFESFAKQAGKSTFDFKPDVTITGQQVIPARYPESLIANLRLSLGQAEAALTNYTEPDWHTGVTEIKVIEESIARFQRAVNRAQMVIISPSTAKASLEKELESYRSASASAADSNKAAEAVYKQFKDGEYEAAKAALNSARKALSDAEDVKESSKSALGSAKTSYSALAKAEAAYSAAQTNLGSAQAAVADASASSIASMSAAVSSAQKELDAANNAVAEKTEALRKVEKALGIKSTLATKKQTVKVTPAKATVKRGKSKTFKVSGVKTSFTVSAGKATKKALSITVKGKTKLVVKANEKAAKKTYKITVYAKAKGAYAASAKKTLTVKVK